MTYAAVLYSGPREITTVADNPQHPEPHQVQIAVAYTGICGTDLHIYHGDMDARVKPPGTVGHEMSGVISALGSDVDGWAVGDHVTVMPLSWCGTCRACTAGHQHVCQNLVFIGIDAAGAMQSQWNVDARTLVRLPADLDLAHAALVEPTAVAVHDVRRGRVAAGERVLVVGAGPIGVLIALVARRAGADVLIIDPDPFRRSIAEQAGLRAAPSDDQVLPNVESWTDGGGADVAFEVSGSAAGVTTALAALGVRARLVQVGIHAQPRQLDLHRVFWRELELLGARLYERADFEDAVALIADGVIPADQLISRIEPIERAAEAFAALERADGVMKVLIDCTSGTTANETAGA